MGIRKSDLDKLMCGLAPTDKPSKDDAYNYVYLTDNNEIHFEVVMRTIRNLNDYICFIYESYLSKGEQERNEILKSYSQSKGNHEVNGVEMYFTVDEYLMAFEESYLSSIEIVFDTIIILFIKTTEKILKYLDEYTNEFQKSRNIGSLKNRLNGHIGKSLISLYEKQLISDRTINIVQILNLREYRNSATHDAIYSHEVDAKQLNTFELKKCFLELRELLLDFELNFIKFSRG